MQNVAGNNGNFLTVLNFKRLPRIKRAFIWNPTTGFRFSTDD